MPRHRVNAAIPQAQEPESATAMLEIEFAEISDCGPVREHNEDFIGHAVPSNPAQTRNRGWIFTLADGVGGQERGEVASQLTVETVRDRADRGIGREPGRCRAATDHDCKPERWWR